MLRPGTILMSVLTASAVLAFSPVASADVQACINASEKGQKLRSSGKLREARENFVQCGAEGCPAIVRHDCSTWNQEIAAILPTVVFGAKDKSGRDMFDVTVSMDGEKLLSKLDGKSVTVDPGKHTFKFESGSLTATETALVKEGEKSRVITVTFDVGGPATATAGTPAATSSTGTPVGSTSPPGADSGGHSLAPWIVVGVGGAALIAGVVIFATTPTRPSNCNAETQKCVRRDGQTDADLADDKDRAGTADSQPVLGAIVGAAGLALIGGGLVWHFLEPTGSKSAVRFSPWTTGKSTGFGLSGSF